MDQLFELIKSLSQTEKRYFRIEASKFATADAPEYLELYDKIEKQIEYDEEKLKKSLKNSSLLKRLPSAKNYLYNLILKILSNYHAEETSFARISRLLHQTDILFDKGLYKQGKKILDKAKKMAETYQQPLLLLLIHERENYFFWSEEQLAKVEQEAARIKKEERAAIQELQNKLNIAELLNQVVLCMYTKGKARNEEGRKVYEAILASEVLEQTRNSELQIVQNHRYAILGLCHSSLHQTTLSLDYNLKRVQSFEAVPHIMAERTPFYLSSVFNLLHNFYFKEKYQEALEQIEHTKNLIQKHDCQLNTESKETYFLINAFHTPRIWMAQGKFEAAAKLSYEVKAEYIERSQKLHKNRTLLTIPMEMVACHFVLGNYSEALFWVRLILNDTSKLVWNDSFGIARILHLLIQYELKNHNILEPYLGSAQRYIQEHENMHKFEQLMLQFVRKLINTTEWDKKYVVIIQKLKMELEQMLEEETFEKRCIVRYHLVSWLESKLQKRAFLEVVLEKMAL